MSSLNIGTQASPLVSAVQDLLKKYQLEPASTTDNEIVDIITFCDHRDFLNLKAAKLNLFMSQRIVLKAFYMGSRGNENLQLTQEEWDWLYKHQDVHEMKLVIERIKNKSVENLTFKELCLVLGRRSGKTLMASVIATYEAYKIMVVNGGDPYDFYGIPLDEKIAVLNVATSQDQAGRLFSAIKARIRNSPFFKGKVDQVSATRISLFSLFDLKRKEGDAGGSNALNVEGSVNIICGHKNPDSLRGWSAICILFDELAFYDEGAKVSGTEFYEALRASIALFDKKGDGRVVTLSSPGPKTGKFYKIWEDSLSDEGKAILSFRIPTWIFNPDIDYETNSELVEARRRDKGKFDIEFGAEWPASSMIGQWFEKELIDRALAEGARNHIIGPEIAPVRGAEYFMHLDPALSNNNYGMVIVRKQVYRDSDGVLRPRCILAYSKAWVPTPGVPLNIPEIDEEVRQIAALFRPVTITYDKWNSAGSIALMKRFHPVVFSTSYDRGYKAHIYLHVKTMMMEKDGSLWLYDDPLLIAEMRSIKYRQIPRGVSIGADPRSDVPTDDMIDCLCGACYMACGNYNNRLPTARFVTGFR